MVGGQGQALQQRCVGGVAFLHAGEGVFLHRRQPSLLRAENFPFPVQELLQGLFPGDFGVKSVQIQHAAGKPAPGTPEHILAQVDVQVPALGLVITAGAGEVEAVLPGGRGGQSQQGDDVHHVKKLHVTSFPGLSPRSRRCLFQGIITEQFGRF